MKYALAGLAAMFLGMPGTLFAAIGCTLSNPAEDLKYLYPEMTSYRENLEEFPNMKDGPELFNALRERLSNDLDPIYETYETPYTVYSVFKGRRKIGIVHGVNVPGKGGVIQIFLSMDPETAVIRRFIFQRLESVASRELKKKEFRMQFEGLTLADFYKHDYYASAPGEVAVSTRSAGARSEADKIAEIKPPLLPAGGQEDYTASLRGIRKNLILLDLFVYGRRFEPFFERAREAARKFKASKE